MSHTVVIIQRVAPPTTTGEPSEEASYTYTMPVPHNLTPQQVGEMVKKAYRKLETPDE